MAEKKGLTQEERNSLAIKLQNIACPAKKKIIYRTCNGIDDGEIKSLSVTGEIFGISRERVRQICL
jgi:DNA-directed RNA polymerase sigma subunit (sigma70/sigma32)